MGAEVVRKMSYVGTEEGAAVSERRGLRIHGSPLQEVAHEGRSWCPIAGGACFLGCGWGEGSMDGGGGPREGGEETVRKLLL